MGIKDDELRKKWLEIPYKIRLIATQFIFRELCEHAKRSGTFRYLIYERLGFYRDAYSPLYLAGGLDISNEFKLKKDGIPEE